MDAGERRRERADPPHRERHPRRDFTPALALPIVELTIARKTKNQNSPYSERAMPSRDEAPDDVKPENPAGPNATSAA